jgi:hypothetical protein
MNSHLDNLARRADTDPFFLGCLLQQYAGSEGLSEQGNLVKLHPVCCGQ